MKTPKDIIDPDIVDNRVPTFKDSNVRPDEDPISNENNVETPLSEEIGVEDSTEWVTFMQLMQTPKKSDSTGSEKRMFLQCKIDPQLAFTLDECKIGLSNRTEMVNNILRAFITSNIDKLRVLRKQRNSLLS